VVAREYVGELLKSITNYSLVRASAILLLCVASAAPAQSKGEWKPMFDGKTLAGWKEAAFDRRGAVRVENGAILLEHGQPLTGVNWTGAFPKSNYEVRFEAARIKGGDFFASLTFPVGDSFATFVTGGWGGDIVGVSSIDGWDASDNETRTYFNFEPGKYYAFRIQVTEDRIAVWIDEERVANVAIAGREISLRPGPIKLSAPFGFASYNTTGGVRKVEYRALPARTTP
jgi:hypothetical protein